MPYSCATQIWLALLYHRNYALPIFMFLFVPRLRDAHQAVTEEKDNLQTFDETTLQQHAAQVEQLQSESTQSHGSTWLQIVTG